MHGLVVHGGAGTILRENITPELERDYLAALREALAAGEAILKHGGSSLDAVEAACLVFEDSPLFNAGKGACYTHDETHELDASIMDGATLAAGAVAGVRTVRNPILLARRVMEQSPHVMLAGEGADAYAKLQGMELVEQEYFHTERRMRQLEKARAREREQGETSLSEDTIPEPGQTEGQKFGTVGACALDSAGNLAAATTTGGMTNKRYGRVGDSPIIGAGTYAENGACAVSCTGHGEYFIKAVAAYDVAARMKYLGESLDVAARAVVHEKLMPMGGRGGLVAIDGEGNVSLPFNSPGMYRGWIDADGEYQVRIFEES